MQGRMMNFPLTLTPILERAGKLFGSVEIVSRRPDRSMHRYTYFDFYRRARALAGALENAGLKPGDRVATLMWNHYVHLEAYFGVPLAAGVLHTLNLRLHADDLAYIANHAGDRFLVVDDVLLPLYEKFKSALNLERVIVVPLSGAAVPSGYDSYESFLATASENFKFPALDEDAAAVMCYTSGTTGRPKGVVYSHRALVLHSFALAMADLIGVSHRDVVLPIVPMFHANAWGLPFAATMVGSKWVLPGPHLDSLSLLELIHQEKVTMAGAVPTVWMSILEVLEKNPGRSTFVPGMRILAGGSAVPEALIRRLDQHGVRLIQAWGLTETTPLATVGALKPSDDGCPEDQKYELRAKQGFPGPFVEMRAVGDAGEIPWDGETMGEIQLRGPWVAASYYNLPSEREKWTPDGWFRTGDVGTIDVEGYLKITDRTKDLIKSGGEWISSVDLESALMGHPAVREAAVIAVPHPKWLERPLALIVGKEGMAVSAEDLRAFLASRFAKWQLPDAFEFVQDLPHTSTGKLLKTELRAQYKNWKWPEPATSGAM